jgi:rhodanese-related sulfurtransferase
MSKSGGVTGKPVVTFASIQQDIENGALFYDVRTQQEFGVGRFERAENWPLQAMQAGELPVVDKDKKIYIHCQSGNRSAQAARILKDAGYTNVIDLGGLNKVKSIGGKLVS